MIGVLLQLLGKPSSCVLAVSKRHLIPLHTPSPNITEAQGSWVNKTLYAGLPEINGDANH